MPAELPLTFTETKTWGLIHKESLLIRSIPNKSKYEPKDIIKLDLNFDNKTKKEITRIITGVHRSLKYGKRTQDTCICEQEIPRNLLPIPSSSKFSEEISLELPGELEASSKSHYISLCYYISFKCEFDNGSDCIIKMPFSVRGSDIKKEAKNEPVINNEPVVDNKPIVNNEPILEKEVKHEESIKTPPIEENITITPNTSQTSLLEFPSGPLPPVPDRSQKEMSELPSFISSEQSMTEEYIPDRILTPQNSESEIIFNSGNIVLAKLDTPTPVQQLPMPYGHPCYFGAQAHYKPPTYVVSEPIPNTPPPAYNPAA